MNARSGYESLIAFLLLRGRVFGRGVCQIHHHLSLSFYVWKLIHGWLLQSGLSDCPIGQDFCNAESVFFFFFFFVLFNFTIACLFSIICVIVLTFINFADHVLCGLDLIKNGLRIIDDRISFLFNIHYRCADTLTDVGTWAMCWTRQTFILINDCGYSMI